MQVQREGANSKNLREGIQTIKEQADAHLKVCLSRCVGQKDKLKKGSLKTKKRDPHTVVNLQNEKLL